MQHEYPDGRMAWRWGRGVKLLFLERSVRLLYLIARDIVSLFLLVFFSPLLFLVQYTNRFLGVSLNEPPEELFNSSDGFDWTLGHHHFSASPSMSIGFGHTIPEGDVLQECFIYPSSFTERITVTSPQYPVEVLAFPLDLVLTLILPFLGKWRDLSALCLLCKGARPLLWTHVKSLHITGLDTPNDVAKLNAPLCLRQFQLHTLSISKVDLKSLAMDLHTISTKRINLFRVGCPENLKLNHNNRDLHTVTMTRCGVTTNLQWIPSCVKSFTIRQSPLDIQQDSLEYLKTFFLRTLKICAPCMKHSTMCALASLDLETIKVAGPIWTVELIQIIFQHPTLKEVTLDGFNHDCFHELQINHSDYDAKMQVTLLSSYSFGTSIGSSYTGCDQQTRQKLASDIRAGLVSRKCWNDLLEFKQQRQVGAFL